MKPRRSVAAVRIAQLAVVALATVIAGFAPVSAQSGDPAAANEAIDEVLEQIDESAEGLDLDEIEGLDALGPNPWLSLTANRSRKSVDAWNKVAAQLPDRAQTPRGKAKIGGPNLALTESEAIGETGVNDTVDTGDKVPSKFGTDPGDRGVVTISGSLSGGVARPPIDADCESSEDDGSIPQANPTPAAQIQIALCIGEIGDGPFGDSSGDVDFYSYGEVEEGTLLILDMAHIAGSLDPVADSIIGIYDAAGNLLASVEDAGVPEDDDFIEVIAPATGEYFAAIAGCCELPADANDSSSGAGVTETGTYELFVVAFPPPCFSEEDDGSISLANGTNVPDLQQDFCLGVIGDGPYGAADTDFYSVGFAPEGFDIVVDAISFVDEPFDTVIGLYDAAGNLVASAEGGQEEQGFNFLVYTVETAGEYFVAVSGCCDLQADPNDPASGVPSDQQGPYEMFIGVFPPPPPPCESVEDDGAIPLANEVTGFDEGILFVGECFGAVGDGPQAGLNGDVDFFRTRPLEAGRILLVDFADFFGEAADAGDLTIAIYNEAGELLATGQDDPSVAGPDTDFFSIVVPEDGTYFVAVGGAAPSDPFDETSGTNTDITSGYSLMFIVDADEEFFSQGAVRDWSQRRPAAERPDYEPQFAGLLSEAKQEARAEAEAMDEEEPVVDTDFFLVHLSKGDAIAGGFDDARTTGIIDPDGVLRSQSSLFNPSFAYPESSALRHDRFRGFDHVATQDGVHAVFVTDGIGEYEGELRVVPAGLSGEKSRNHQIIFLDFDGAFLPGDTFGTGIDADMSPLSAFMGNWGLTGDDEDDVIDATIDAVVETLDSDLRVLDGRNGDRDATRRGTEFDVEILNSRDHGDRWGDANVSRVVIGGTIDEVQIGTIGIAQSIDPGNQDTEETGIVLLDIISGSPEEFGDASANFYPIADGASKADLVGFYIGHITAHEIGHFIGNWHQETFNEVDALMDAGGDFPAFVGVGDDGVFGTDDDTDPDFVEDIFNVFEGFSGVEDTAGRSAFALSTGQLKVPGGGPR